MNKPHIDAALMLQYAQDAAETDEPWTRWEYTKGEDWCSLGSHPIWGSTYKYRRKPKTININGTEVPEPLRVQPAYAERYYLVDTSQEEIAGLTWSDDGSDNKWFQHGLIHNTKEAARVHRNALLSFTRID